MNHQTRHPVSAAWLRPPVRLGSRITGRTAIDRFERRIVSILSVGQSLHYWHMRCVLENAIDGDIAIAARRLLLGQYTLAKGHPGTLQSERDSRVSNPMCSQMSLSHRIWLRRSVHLDSSYPRRPVALYAVRAQSFRLQHTAPPSRHSQTRRLEHCAHIRTGHSADAAFRVRVLDLKFHQKV